MNILEYKRGFSQMYRTGRDSATGSMGGGNHSTGGYGGGGGRSGGGGRDAAGAPAGSAASAASAGIASGRAATTAANSGGGGGFSFNAAKDSQAASNDMAAALSRDFGISAADAQTAIGATNGAKGEVSPGGMTYSTLNSLNSLGYGALQGVNPNNLTQSVGELANSRATGDFIAKYAPMLPSLMGVPPGYMALFNGAKALASGETTIGGLIAGAGLAAVAAKMGIPTGTLSSMMAGDFGKAAAQTATNALMGAIAGQTGISGMVVGAIGKETGLTQALFGGVQNAVNGLTGGLSSTGTGFSAGSLAGAIDGAIGGVAKDRGMSVPDLNNRFDPSTTLGHYLPSGGGGAQAPGTPAAPTQSAPGTPAPQQAAQPSLMMSSAETEPADIYGGRLDQQMYDPFGDSIFQAPQPQADALKYLRDGGLVANAAEGGSIDDILEYLRR